MFDYELIDSGEKRRIERFGEFVLNRPAPQADWVKLAEDSVWDSAHATYCTKTDAWINTGSVPETWEITVDDFKMNLSLLDGGQVGIFPEQYENWEWLSLLLSGENRELNILNGFSYSGASSLACAVANPNIKICNIDASKTSMTRMKSNIVSSEIEETEIKLIVDDMISFLQREVKRENKYDGIILDPPAFGKASKGKTWSIVRDLTTLIDLAKELLTDKPLFFLISCHDKRVDKNMLVDYLTTDQRLNKDNIEELDLVIESTQGSDLPSGICVRWQNMM